VSAAQLRAANGAELSSSTLGAGGSGDISLKATSRLTIIQEAQVNASTSGGGAGGNIRLEAPTVEALNGARIGSTAQSTGDGGNIAIVASDAFVATGTNGVADPANNRGSRITTSSFFTSTGDAGSISVQAGRVELADGARLSSSTSGIGNGGSITIVATGDVSLRGARGDGSGSAIKASTEVDPGESGAVNLPRIGYAGTVAIQAASLTLADGAEIVGNTALLGAGGRVAIDVGSLHVSNARIASESTAVGDGAGAAGEIAVDANDITLENGARISASTVDGTGGAITLHAATVRLDGGSEVSVATTGLGNGGDVAISANTIDLTGGSVISASGSGAGKAGALRLMAADTLTLDSSALRTSALASAGGDIVIEAGHTVELTDSTIGAQAGGVTATDAGGNVTIDPDYVLLNRSDILASANAGNGGNITITAGFFVASADSAIDASSTRGLDGEILIDSPNELTGSVLPLTTPVPVVAGLLAQNCTPRLARERSTLTVRTRASAHAPTGYLPSPPVTETAPAKAADGGARKADAATRSC
jgi:large exoprotein involved in heme utilization and adhesion